MKLYVLDMPIPCGETRPENKMEQTKSCKTVQTSRFARVILCARSCRYSVLLKNQRVTAKGNPNKQSNGPTDLRSVRYASSVVNWTARPPLLGGLVNLALVTLRNNVRERSIRLFE